MCIRDSAKPVEGLQVDLPVSHGDEKELTDAQGNAELDGSYVGFRKDHQVVLEVKDVYKRQRLGCTHRYSLLSLRPLGYHG